MCFCSLYISLDILFLAVRLSVDVMQTYLHLKKDFILPAKFFQMPEQVAQFVPNNIKQHIQFNGEVW